MKLLKLRVNFLALTCPTDFEPFGHLSEVGQCLSALPAVDSADGAMEACVENPLNSPFTPKSRQEAELVYDLLG